MERYIQQYFAQQGVSQALQTEFLREIFNKLESGIDEGWNFKAGFEVEPNDLEIIQQLKHNSAVFSIFKKHDYNKNLLNLLLDEDGNIRSREAFIAEARKLNDKHLKRWFATEYDMALTTANMARKWRDYEGQAHLYPNLEYVAVMDSRTRPLHRAWDGTILPINHPFWDTHYPPNDWGCRCDALQTDQPVNANGRDVDDMPALPKIFNNNAGKTGKAFTQDHPVFNVPGADAVLSTGVAAMLRTEKRKARDFVRTQSYRHEELGTIQVSKKGIEKIQHMNTNEDALKLVLLVPYLESLLEKMILSPGIELPNKDKKLQKPNILHYRRGTIPFSKRDIQLIFEKDNSTAEDYKFYGMQWKEKSDDS